MSSLYKSLLLIPLLALTLLGAGCESILNHTSQADFDRKLTCSKQAYSSNKKAGSNGQEAIQKCYSRILNSCVGFTMFYVEDASKRVTALAHGPRIKWGYIASDLLTNEKLRDSEWFTRQDLMTSDMTTYKDSLDCI